MSCEMKLEHLIANQLFLLELLKNLCILMQAFEEAELAKLKEEKPGLTLHQYKDMIWKLWKKSPDNLLNQVQYKPKPSVLIWALNNLLGMSWSTFRRTGVAGGVKKSAASWQTAVWHGRGHG